MSKQYQIKQVETNQRGHKVVTTVSTDDPEVAKSLIGTAASTQSAASKKKTTKSSTTSKSKKGVVIDAEFTEVKSKKTTKSSKAAKSSKKTVAKPTALPAPVAKKKDSKKSETKKPALKAYVYLIKGANMKLHVYAPDKAGADKLSAYFSKRTNLDCSYIRTSNANYHQEEIRKQHLTADNYYQKQVASIDSKTKYDP